MPGGFVKLYGTILDSSVWSEDPYTRLVWITMLAMADADGFVEAAVPGLARRANVPLDACESALARLQSPDPYSKSPDHEGRRVERTERGWVILNYKTYRELRTDNQASNAERQRRWRERHLTPKRAELIGKIVARDGAVCGICKCAVDPSSAEIDHITPKTKGGSDSLSNFQLAHSECNKRKNNRYSNASNAPSREVSASLSVVSSLEGGVGGELPPDIRGESLLRQSRVAKERLFYARIARLAELQPEKDPTQIAREITCYTAKDGREVAGVVRPETLSDTRLDKSLADAEWWVNKLEGASGQAGTAV